MGVGDLEGLGVGEGDGIEVGLVVTIVSIIPHSTVVPAGGFFSHSIPSLYEIMHE